MMNVDGTIDSCPPGMSGVSLLQKQSMQRQKTQAVDEAPKVEQTPAQAAVQTPRQTTAKATEQAPAKAPGQATAQDNITTDTQEQDSVAERVAKDAQEAPRLNKHEDVPVMNSNVGDVKHAVTEETKHEEGTASNEHEEHGEESGEGSHGEEHEEEAPPSDMDIALGIMLLGTVGFVMALFYLVNWYDRDIVSSTWKMLSATISIFSAVLIFLASKELMMFMLGEPPHEHGKQPDVKILAHDAFRFLIWTLLMGAVLHALKQQSLNVIAFGSLAAHITGFAAIDLFGGIQSTALLNDSVPHSLCSVGVAAVSLSVVFSMTAFIRQRAYSGREAATSQEMQHNEVCCDCEDDVAGLALGLMISRVVRFIITEELPPLHGQPKHKTANDCHALLGVAVIFGVLVMLFEQFIHWGRHVKIAQVVSSMTMGFCLLYSGQWAFWATFGDAGLAGHSSKMLARIVMALFDSVLVLGAIFIVDFIADRMESSQKALRTLMTSLGLLLGLAWEAAFDQSVEGIEEKFAPHDKTRKICLKLAMTFGLCIVVLPAWRNYILPMALLGAGRGSAKSGLEESVAESLAGDSSAARHG